MNRRTIIAAVGRNNELGHKGGLCFRLRKDMRWFHRTTIWGKVVMGYNTMLSLKNYHLRERENYVLCRPGTHSYPQWKAIYSVDEMPKDCYIIGGASMYAQTIDLAGEILLTEIDAEAPADCFFPEFDKSKYNKTIIYEGEERGIKFKIVQYEKKGLKHVRRYF